MKVRRIISWLGVGAALLALVAFTIISTACGGGGRRKPPGTTPVTTPSTGAVEWVHTWNGSGDACALALDNDWNAHIAGSTWRFGAGDSDVSILKLTPYGNVLWGKTWGGADKEECYALASNGTGGIYVAGLTESFSVGGSYDLFLLNYGPNGNILWQKTWGGIGRDAAHALSVDYDGNIYAVGFTSSFGAGGRDALILKYSPDGSLLWAKTWGGSDWDYANGIAIDGNGDVVVVGMVRSLEERGSAALPVSPEVGGYSALLLKYSPDGSLLWGKTWAGRYEAHASAVAIGKNNEAYVAGYTRSYNVNVKHAFLLSYTSNGDLVWQKTWGGWQYEDDDSAYALAVDGSGNIYVVGKYSHVVVPSRLDSTHGRNGIYRLSGISLLKCSSYGKLLWRRIYDRSFARRVESFALDESGKAVLAGCSRRFSNQGFWWNASVVLSSPSGTETSPEGIEGIPEGIETVPEGIEAEPEGAIDDPNVSWHTFIMKYDPS